ncbi:MAG: alpha/beta hydrolase-fold protein [Melioribacteraceae bacterium]|nr:hypothetical protein [Melioribacteraceae bacterium]MDD3558190.1 alpha/beta hydrolase-fold protein [Melioribacteraceae bacterium]
MKHKFIIAFVFLNILMITTCAQSNIKEVKIVVEAEGVENGEAVFIAGNNEKLGNWAPDAVQLENNGNVWEKTFEFYKEAILEFKITKGSWDKEALTDDNKVPDNYIFKVNADTTVYLKITKWKGRDPISGGFKGQITGTVEYHKDFTMEGLRPRDIIVWLPPGYFDKSARRYPVLYMHDGQNIVDPNTSSFGIDWQIDETADSLIRSQEIEPFILIGINNTADRFFDYSPGEKGKAYMKLIIEKIKPFIDSNYKTLHCRENTAVGGSSMGGLISFMIAWEHPEVFSKAICMSPAFKFNQVDYVKEVKSYNGEKKDIVLYIDNGGVGLEETLQPGIDEMLEALQGKGYEEGKDYIWIKDNEAEHNEPAWAKRMSYPLKIFYGK